MSYCINPNCPNRHNSDNLEYCQACGTQLLINNRYRLVKPLRQLSEEYFTEIFEVDDRGQMKVLKSLRKNRIKLIELFEQEVNILTHLRHSGIPKAELNESFTFLLNNGYELRCLVMERVRGQNLEQWLNENDDEPISQELALDWLKQIAKILGYVHQNHFFHRDIKPSNIIRKPNGQLVLIDFGTARKVTETVINGRGVTIVYSDGYTAPEQIEGKAVPQSDFFALGRTLVHLLTGQHPNDFSTDSETRQLMWRDSAPQTSAMLADFIDKLMERSLERRPQDTQEILRTTEQIILHTTLQRLKEIDPVKQQPPLEEQPEQPGSIIPILARVELESSPYSVLSPEQYSQVEKILMELIGPIAPTLLQQVGGQVLSHKELVENLVLFLPLHQRLEFEKKVMSLLQESSGQFQTKPNNLISAKNQVVNEIFVRQCETELADLIGPIATFLVQKILKASPQISPIELVNALAAEIPDIQKATEFQQRLAS
ncbi:MAG: serine/threonine-protein kinase [Cyanobacteriota bacterium]